MDKRNKSSKELLTSEDTPPRTAPTIERVAEGEVNIHVSGQDEIKRLYGTKTEDAANILFKSAINALGRNADGYLELMPAMAVEMEPRDAVEAMLVSQMTATHLAMTTMSQKFHHTDYPDVREAYERSMTRLSRTFLSQMEGLKKYRAKAQQVVRVERVEVNEGGKAIVGDVSYRKGGRMKKSDANPMSPVERLRDAPRCQAKVQVQRRALQVPGGPRVARMPRSRRGRRSSRWVGPSAVEAWRAFAGGCGGEAVGGAVSWGLDRCARTHPVRSAPKSYSRIAMGEFLGE